MGEPESRPHLDAATVADLDAGVLEPARATAVVTHLDSCRQCQGLRSGLAEVSALLRAQPTLGMPADVATRLDAALQRAVEARAADEDHESRVVALAPRRLRWLAPLAAAATLVVAVAVGNQVLQSQAGDDSRPATAEQNAPAGGTAAGQGSPESGDAGRESPSLTTESFGSDVVREFYSATAGVSPKRGDAASQLRGALQKCQPAEALAFRGQARPVLLDGRPALLFLSGPRANRLALAVSCESGGPLVAARARLDLD